MRSGSSPRLPAAIVTGARGVAGAGVNGNRLPFGLWLLPGVHRSRSALSVAALLCVVAAETGCDWYRFVPTVEAALVDLRVAQRGAQRHLQVDTVAGPVLTFSRHAVRGAVAAHARLQDRPRRVPGRDAVLRVRSGPDWRRRGAQRGRRGPDSACSRIGYEGGLPGFKSSSPTIGNMAITSFRHRDEETAHRWARCRCWN